MRHRDRRQQKSTPSGPSAPPTARGFATRGRRLLAEHLAQIVHLHPAQLNVARCLLLHTRQRRGDCTAFQGIIATESGHGAATVRRTERALERYGLLRIAYHHGHRRLWWTKLYLALARAPRLPPRRFYRVFGALILHIQAALKTPVPNHRRPPIAARPDAQSPTAASGISADPTQPQDWRGPQPTPATEDRSPMSDNTSLQERREIELHGAPAEASLPDGREPRTPKPPAPAGRHATATPTASSPPPFGRPQRAPGLDPVEAPARKPPASGGRGEGPSARTPRAPEGEPTWTLADLAARGALIRRFETTTGAALRSDLPRLHDLMPPGPLPEALPRLILRAITATLGCTDEDADFLARRAFKQLRDQRRRGFGGPPPVPRTIRTDATGQPWVLEYEQPDPVRR